MSETFMPIRRKGYDGVELAPKACNMTTYAMTPLETKNGVWTRGCKFGTVHKF